MLEQEKLLTTELQKMNILNSAINSLQQAQKRAEDAFKMIDSFSETAKIYRPLGRM